MPILSAAEIVKLDKEAIYIGNIYTVENDLELPDKGKNGSSITWHSNKPYIVSDEGKVTRPHAGSGNRDVVLTATITYEDSHDVREFNLTVLQVKSNFKIVKLYTSKIYVKEGEKPVYPSIVVAENDNGQFSALPVSWKNGCGHVEGTELEAMAEIVTIAEKQASKPSFKAHAFKHGNTILLSDSLFYENQERAISYLLSIDDDEMLYNFRDASGLDTMNAKPMLGWDAPECKLKGHTTGHYLSALSLASVSGHEHATKCLKKLKYMICELGKCQAALQDKGCNFGFLSGYLEEQFDLLEVYTKYPDIWAPYYTLHKIFAGLIDAFTIAGLDNALTIAEKLGTWIYNRLNRLSNEQRNKMWAMYIAGEYGGINESLAKLYSLTGNKNFLTAAEFFNNDKLFYPMLHGFDTLGGIHANQHIPQIVGVMEMFNQTGNEDYYKISRNFWEFVTNGHIYNIGGTGEGEMFRPAGEISKYLSDKTAETCASYNMLKLTGMLFSHEPDVKYMNYYEKTLYNHIAASQDQSGAVGGSTYFMPLSPGSKKGFDTDSNTCCHGTGMENHLKYSEYIYFKNDDTLYVNLYIPSVLTWEEKNISVTQTGDYLRDNEVTFKISGDAEFKLSLRIPEWLDKFEIYIDGKKQNHLTARLGYLDISRRWHGNTEIKLKMPFSFRIEDTPDKDGCFSIYYGPLVMVAVDDSLEFIRLKLSDIAMTPTEKPLCFECGGIQFIPNYEANKCHYHAYFIKS